MASRAGRLLEVWSANGAAVFEATVLVTMAAEAVGQEAAGTNTVRPEAVGADSTGGKRRELRPWGVMLWRWRPRGASG